MLVPEITWSYSHAPTSTPRSYTSGLGCPTPIAACSRLTGETAAAEDGWHHHAHVLGSDVTLCISKALSLFLHSTVLGTLFKSFG